MTHNGYGCRTDNQRVHRWVWEQAHGPIPDGMMVLHRCDNRLCFRLDHLELGTAAANTAHMVERGRTVQRHDHQRVRDLRSQGHTQTEIARMTGMSQSHVSRVVNS